MRQTKVILLSSMAAVLVQPLVLLAWLGLPSLFAGESAAFADVARFSIFAAFFAIPFVLVVGVPATLLLSRYGKLQWWPLALIGSLTAMLPIAASGPGGGAGYSSGGNWRGKVVDYVVDGEPTLYGWLSYLESITYFGIHGLVGASVFYVVWRRSMGPNNSFKPKPLRGSA